MGYAGAFEPDFTAAAYYELHIEQGPVLETAGVPIGVVTSIQGVRWYAIQLHGRDAHAGTTPSGARRDSFMAAARLSLRLREEALTLDQDLRFTVGRVEVEPNSQNTIPGLTTLFIDVRHASTQVLERFEHVMANAVSEVALIEGTSGKFRRTMSVPPVLFNESLQDRLMAGARTIGVEPIRLPSGAMHDASSLAAGIPSAMIFVQSRDGISHNPDEWSEPAHVAAACEALAQAIVSQACTATNVADAAHD
ncbi:hydantoinase/carbamoylase family amidase [Neoaquamicrobium sediminum]|uniref:hydantoinase/carbamoylase family amidase n=1 Tax=Neoaquamicrobium sediminum TaxID=1849104 RepID=UPI0028B0F6FD|nr:hydantoinase/carbamoylase family amidase [Mesorhizobium sediminum]